MTARLMQYAGRLNISVITLGELQTWACRAGVFPRRREALGELLRDAEVLPVSPAIGLRFGELRAALFDAGRPVPELDLFIAATAIEHDLTLVTHNTADYEAVPGLSFTDRVAEP